MRVYDVSPVRCVSCRPVDDTWPSFEVAFRMHAKFSGRRDYYSMAPVPLGCAQCPVCGAFASYTNYAGETVTHEVPDGSLFIFQEIAA